jgi:hypothetical protein
VNSVDAEADLIRRAVATIRRIWDANPDPWMKQERDTSLSVAGWLLGVVENRGLGAPDRPGVREWQAALTVARAVEGES